jgi:hypothetical protein
LKKYIRRLLSFLLCLSLLLSSAFVCRVNAADARKIVYGYSGAGRELTAYRFGSGENVLVVGFGIHGYEDNWAKDGQALLYTAQQLMNKLSANASLLTDYNWSVYVLPSMNPDGLLDGWTNNGPGRCTTSYIQDGALTRNGGVDLNRCFPTGWKKYTDSRNFNGDAPLAAKEAQALADFVENVKGTGTNLCIDTHGWTTQIITSNGYSALYDVFKAQFPQNSYAGFAGGGGYFAAYAASLGYISCLFEFPNGIYSMEDFQSSGYSEKYCASILELLRVYGRDGAHHANCPSNRFEDVGVCAWYHAAIDYVLDAGYFNGANKTQFLPNTATNRAMLVTVLWRAAGSPEANKLHSPFADVKDAKYYADAVAWAQENGIVNGYPDGCFYPDRSISRQELAAVFYRFAQWQGRSTAESASLSAFKDAQQVSAYARSAIRWAYATGLVQGVSDTQIDPHAAATRAQTATILMRYFGG